MANNQNFKVKNGLDVGAEANITNDINLGGDLYLNGGSIVFEGTTEDGFETTLTVVDPTADRTITLPDGDGTFVLGVSDTTTTTQGDLNLDLTVSGTGVLSTTGDAHGLATTDSPTFNNLNLNGGLNFEGTTADGFETTLTVTDPTADRTITLPNASGTVAVSVSDTTTTTQGDLNLDLTLSATGNVSATGDAHGLATTDSPTFAGLTINGNTIVLEGATANAFETQLNTVDPTQENIIDIPDNSGTFAVAVDNTTTTTQGDLNVTMGLNATGVVTASGDAHGLATTDSPQFTGLTLTSNLDVQGNTTLGNAASDTITFNGTITGSTPLVFEGATANDFETSFVITDPTQDRTITFPDASGTVAFTSGSDVLTVSGASGTTTLQTGDTLTITGGTYLTSSVAGDTVTINHDSTTRTNNTSTSSPGYAGTFTAVDSVTTNATGHVTAINTKTVTLPSAENYTYSFTATADSGTDQAIENGNTLDIAGGTYITTSVGATDTVTVTHDSTTRTDATSTASPAFGGTFTAVDSVTTNATGHVSAINVKTVTLPTPSTDAETLDGIDSTSFLRSDTGDEATGIINFSNGSTFFSNTSDTGDVDIYLAQGTGGGLTGRATVQWDDSQTSLRMFNVESATSLNVGSTLTWSTTALGNRPILYNDYNGNILPDSTANNRNLGSATRVWNTVYATTFEGTATNAQYADLAEKYLADAEYPIGTVISIGGVAEVTATNIDTEHSVLGVVSEKPAYLMNKDLEGGTAIALKGRVPVRVQGTVRKGDRLAPSDESGVAKVDNRKSAWSFAIALEDGTSIVEAVIL